MTCKLLLFLIQWTIMWGDAHLITLGRHNGWIMSLLFRAPWRVVKIDDAEHLRFAWYFFGSMVVVVVVVCSFCLAVRPGNFCIWLQQWPFAVELAPHMCIGAPRLICTFRWQPTPFDLRNRFRVVFPWCDDAKVGKQSNKQKHKIRANMVLFFHFIYGYLFGELCVNSLCVDVSSHPSPWSLLSCLLHLISVVSWPFFTA